MATLKDYRDERLRKLADLKELGVDPYPARADRTHHLTEITDHFDQLNGQEVGVVGRIVNIRKFGKIAFIVIRDASGHAQLFFREGAVEGLKAEDSQLGLEQLPLLDSGDFVQAHGPVIKTQTGEISVEVHRLRLLAKALRPLPHAQDGFTNKEERLRRRYVDTNANQDVYQRYLRRSSFWQATRELLMNEGFIEMSTPVLELTTGGADATPFVTHMDALDQDFYLRISHELPLKRLLVGGYEKVFDIGPRFRNENYSDEHLPEHNAMEWYWAYADWEQGMHLTERLIRFVADQTWGKRQFKLANGMEIDLGPDGQDWPRISFVDIIRDNYGLDVFSCSLDEVKEQLKKHSLEVEKSENRSRGIDKLWKKVRTTIGGPAFLVDIPTFLQPLAKMQPGKPELTEQFNLLLGGSELCKAYSELNDPIDQLNRFKEQQAMRDAGDDEAMMLDIDYIEALEYAMPPACGFGYSERVFWFLEGVTAREGVIFPQLRREIDEVTKAIYPDLSLGASQPAPKAAAGHFVASAKLSDTVSFEIDNKIRANFQPSIGYLVVTLPDAPSEVSSDPLQQALESLQARGVTTDNLTDQPEIAAWRAAFKTFGVKPSKYLSSAEALAKRALKGNPARISPVVDAYNAVSLKHLVPMGAVDLDKVNGNITLRYGQAGENAHLLGMDAPVDVSPEHVVYADDGQVITWLWNHRDAAATAVTHSSKHVVFFTDSLLGPELAQTAISELAALLDQLGAMVIEQGVIGETSGHEG